MNMKKISGPFNLLQSSDVAQLKVQMRDLRNKGVHVETRPSTRYKIGVDLYRQTDGMTTGAEQRLERIRSGGKHNAMVNQNGGRHR